MAIPTLFGSYIDETYERLVQVSGSEFADGLGNPITFGTINTGSLLQSSVFNQFTASYSTGSFRGSFTGSLQGTASFVTGSIFVGNNLARSASFALTASISINATNAGYANSAGYATSAGNATSADNINGYSNATSDRINIGQPSDGTYNYIVRAEELEQSKHNTINIFNYLNFT